MPIQAINVNTDRKKNSSYLSAAAIGVLGGLTAKYAVPVSRQELDTFVSQSLVNGHKKLSKKEISTLAKASRSTFDFAVVTALTFVALTFFKNMYNKLADKSK